MYFTETRTRFKTNFAKDPCVVKYNGKYFLYYSVFECGVQGRLCLGVASSYDMENWKIVGEIMPETGVEAKLFYQGTNDKGTTWYLSKKEITFKNGIPEIID